MGLRAQYRKQKQSRYRKLSEELPIKAKKPKAKKKRYIIKELEEA